MEVQELHPKQKSAVRLKKKGDNDENGRRLVDIFEEEQVDLKGSSAATATGYRVRIKLDGQKRGMLVK